MKNRPQLSIPPSYATDSGTGNFLDDPRYAEEVGAPRRRRRTGENRERLILAGIIEFSDLGFRGTSTTSVALRAQVPQPHVYTNFPSKQALFLACVERVVAASVDGVGRPGLEAQTTNSPQLILQAVAAVAEETLQPDLGHLLRKLEIELGEKNFEQMLIAGARSLTTRVFGSS